MSLTSEAGAGDVVHFSISDIDEDETYVLEIGAHRLAEGSGTDAEQVSGQFAMPDLGGGARTVTVEAEIGERGDMTTVKRTLRYLGALAPAPAIAGPSPTPPAPVPAAPTPTVGTPKPTHATTTPDPPASRATVDRKRSKRARRQARKRTTERRRVEGRPNTSTVKRAKSREEKVKPKRERARTAPLFDGVPESSRASASPGRSTGSSGVNESALPSTTFTRAATDGAYAGPAAAVLVPMLLGLAALALVGTALLRNRRKSR